MSDRETRGEELSALLDGMLPADRAAELQRLIASDPDVRAEYERLRRAVEGVRSLPRVRAPEDLKSRVLGRRRGVLRWLVPLTAVAAALLAALLWTREDATPRREEAVLAPEPDPPPPAPSKEAVEVSAPSVQRSAYLEHLETLDAPDLRRAIEAGAPLPAPDDRVADATAQSVGSEERLDVGSEAEAKTIRALLQRAYPAPKARLSAATKPDSTITFVIEAPSECVDSIRAWLRSLAGVTHARGALASEKSKGEGSGEGPRAPLRIVLLYPEAEKDK